MGPQQRLEQLDRERVQTRNRVLALLDDNVISVLRLHARPELADQLEHLLQRDEELSANIADVRYVLRQRHDRQFVTPPGASEGHLMRR